jgi:hypothetical protein
MKHQPLPGRLTLPILLICASLLGGCSQLLYRQTCVALATDVTYCLAPLPRQFTQPIEDSREDDTEGQASRSLTQKISLSVGTDSHELLSQIEMDRQGMTLIGLAPLGQALFTLIFDGNTLSSQQSILLGDSFKAEYLMALLQLIYWPQEQLQPALQGGELVAGACPDDLAPERHCRDIYARGDGKSRLASLISIRYSEAEPWQSQVMLSIPQAALTLSISPI